jgi:hypothetical protein
MAWFENDNKINIQQTQKRPSTWKMLASELTFLKKIPFVNSLYQYFLQRNIHKKLDQLESKIASSPMENFPTVLSLYKLLFQTHKSLHQDNNRSQDTSLLQRIQIMRHSLITELRKMVEVNDDELLQQPIIAETSSQFPNNFSWLLQKANPVSQNKSYYLFWQQRNNDEVTESKPSQNSLVISEEQQDTKGPGIHLT